ncbi:MAG TPA: cytochrome-c peroxidase [Phaeodactylibacter sp.]|nr:cytochrome-c peroxidase [Phaeodactylibacter sp.]
MKKYILLSLLIGLLFGACKKDDPNAGGDGQDDQLNTDLQEALKTASNGVGVDYYKLPTGEDLSQIPQDPNNPLTEAKVKLGKLLYHETGLAINPMKEISRGTYSCASCHFASAGFQAGRFQGISEGGVGFGVNGEGRQKGALYAGGEIDVQPLRTPTSMNGAYQKNNLWNGQFGATGINEGTEALWTAGTPKETNLLGYEGLETQAIAGLKVHRMGANEEFLSLYPIYKTYIDEAFPDVDSTERYTRTTMGLAVGAYERTLLSSKAPFQEWLRGDNAAMSDTEKKGAILFFGKAKCANCHNGPALSSMEFYAYGMKDLNTCPEEVFQADNAGANLGRGGFTNVAADNYKFKVPQLYNLADSPFYGHGASLRSLREVVMYKNNGVAENAAVPASQLAADFVPLNLTNEEVDAITAFMEKSLRDPDLGRYQPESVPSGNCIPVNDPLSKNELGCN